MTVETRGRSSRFTAEFIIFAGDRVTQTGLDGKIDIAYGCVRHFWNWLHQQLSDADDMGLSFQD